MKKAIVLSLLCLFFSQSYSQFNLLEEAYKKKSKEKLNVFFIDWKKTIRRRGLLLKEQLFFLLRNTRTGCPRGLQIYQKNFIYIRN